MVAGFASGDLDKECNFLFTFEIELASRSFAACLCLCLSCPCPSPRKFHEVNVILALWISPAGEQAWGWHSYHWKAFAKQSEGQAKPIGTSNRLLSHCLSKQSAASWTLAWLLLSGLESVLCPLQRVSSARKAPGFSLRGTGSFFETIQHSSRKCYPAAWSVVGREQLSGRRQSPQISLSLPQC